MKTDTQIAEGLAAGGNGRAAETWRTRAYERAVQDGDLEEIERLTQMPAETGDKD